MSAVPITDVQSLDTPTLKQLLELIPRELKSREERAQRRDDEQVVSTLPSIIIFGRAVHCTIYNGQFWVKYANVLRSIGIPVDEQQLISFLDSQATQVKLGNISIEKHYDIEHEADACLIQIHSPYALPAYQSFNVSQESLRSQLL